MAVTTATGMADTVVYGMADPMADPAAAAPATVGLLSLMWLASPALPIGGFSYSEGLEAAVDAGLVHDEASTARWLSAQAHLCLQRSELPALRDAWRGWRSGDVTAVREVNAWVLQTRESAELRLQTEQMGRSLLEWLRQQGTARPDQLEALTDMDPTYPVSFALALSLTPASERDGLLAFGFGWCEAMVQAALKAVPLGQNAGQRVLRQLAQQLPGCVDGALSPHAPRQCFSPMLAILSARHETQYSRLFRS